MKNHDDSRRRLLNFASNLDSAVTDRRLELNGVQIDYYYDADVVLRMVMGFEFDQSRTNYSSNETRLVRALLSCGFFGQISILLPHAIEFSHVIRRMPLVKKSDHADFSKRALLYLKEQGIESLARDFQTILSRKGSSKSDVVAGLLEVLRESAGLAFAALESINGSWNQRLRRYRDSNLLRFDNMGSEMAHLLPSRSSQFDFVLKSIRTTSPTRTDASDVHDSAALIMLCEMIEAAQEQSLQRVVRFYTETPTLRQAWLRSKQLRNMLSYTDLAIDSPKPTDESRFIVRDALYFLLRAIFPELAPNSKLGGLGRIEELLSLLKNITSRGEKETEEALRWVAWEGRTLGDLIRDFEDYSILKSIWVDGNLPRRILDELPEWGDVLAFLQDSDTGGRIFSEIEDIRQELEGRLVKIRVWSHDFELFITAGRDAKKRISASIENPMRDLGLVRWGYNLSDYDQELLAQTVKAALSDSDEDLFLIAAELASRMEVAKRDVEVCLFMCAVLWALRRFNEIVGLVKDCELAAHIPLPATLTVISAAAELKCRIISREERAHLVNSVWRLGEGLSQEASAGILLGIAYVLYHAWKQETFGNQIHQRPISEEAKEWARQSISATEKASHILPPSNLAWAFSINHCAYVGIITGEGEHTEKYFQELFRLQEFSFWNSRFDDTLGIYYLKRAESGLNNLSEKGIDRRELLEDLSKARYYFFRAKASDFGDIDLDEHIARLDWIRVSIVRGSEE